MDIARPSLYAAFGNKEELFCKALDRYVEQKVAHVRKAFEEPTARGVAERLLRGGADMLTDPCHPRGCLAVQGALSCGDAADSVRQELVSPRARMEALLCPRLARAKTDGHPTAARQPVSETG